MNTHATVLTSDKRATLVVEDLRCTCCAEYVLDSVRSLDGVREAALDSRCRVSRGSSVETAIRSRAGSQGSAGR